MLKMLFYYPRRIEYPGARNRISRSCFSVRIRIVCGIFECKTNTIQTKLTRHFIVVSRLVEQRTNVPLTRIDVLILLCASDGRFIFPQATTPETPRIMRYRRIGTVEK